MKKITFLWLLFAGLFTVTMSAQNYTTAEQLEINAASNSGTTRQVIDMNSIFEKVSNAASGHINNRASVSGENQILTEQEATAYRNYMVMQNRNVLVDIIPTAGATETFPVVAGDFIYDPSDGTTGGPGGDCTTTSSGDTGDYPNCSCFTTTTYTGTDLQIEFSSFNVFGNFDFLNIYDGPDTSSPQIYDSNLNASTDTLAGMIDANGSAVFTSTSGALTFEFMATGVVNSCGWEAEVTSGGGGGGGAMACNQEHTAAGSAAGSGVGSSLDSDFKTAADITVAAGENFTIDAITASFLTFAPSDPPVNATVTYYEDAAGFPGAMIGTETLVPTIVSAMPWVNPIADVYETSLAITPFTFAGDMATDTKYWIEIAMGTATAQGTVFWEGTTDTTIEGEPAVQFDATTGNWTVPLDGTTGLPQDNQEVIYNFSGDCEAIGGGATACSEDTTASPFGAAYGTNTPALQVIGHDITVDAMVDFTLNTLTYYLLVNVGATVTTADIVIYNDAAGIPDVASIIDTQTLVPTSQTVLGPNGTNEILEVVYDLTPVLLAGELLGPTTYWATQYVTMSSGTLGASLASVDPALVVGNLAVFSPDAGTTFGTIPDNEIIYVAAGDCEDIEITNDLCDFATDVECGDVVAGDTSDDTDSGGNAAPDEFFQYTGDGIPLDVTLSLCDGGTGYDSLIRVYTDCTLATEIASNDDSCGLQSELTFESDGTSTYYIMIEGFGNNSGAFSLAVTCASTIDNDLCENAIALDCGDSVTGTTTGALIDNDVAGATCGTDITAPGVWYVFDDASGLEGDITATLCNGTDFDSKISVFTGDCSALVCLDGNDDDCGLQSTVTFPTDGATTFYILVHGFAANTGNFTLDLTCMPTPPPNDMIANSIDVDQIGFPYTDPAVAMPAATLEAGDASGCSINGSAGVWYNFVAGGSGTATASITSPGGASAVIFYTAPDENASETDLVHVDQFNNQCVGGTSASISTLAGQAYYVFVVNTGAISDIVIDGTLLGTNENTIEGFAFYPNPANDQLNVTAQNTIDSVSLFNVLGQKVIDQNVGAASSQLDVSSLPTGTYIMKVSVDGEIGTYKVIKQ